ncbi:Lamin tail domain-containing protein 2 [Galemys pyrenaicus]|uniref:Lamin tail domain-containing protein 2 n=1 Tax=Galemys pyrenaicus TaxID=202257 RepID=A0A8J6DQ65_GALPY|nr:Lamin tail domain-containing protein 2 [Galemys pyrenaicus]
MVAPRPHRPAPDQMAVPPAEDGSWKLGPRKEQRLKSVEWCSLPLAGGSADTDSSGSQREAPHSPRKGPARWRGLKAVAEPQEAQAPREEGLSLGLQKPHSDLPGKTVSAPQSSASAGPQDPRYRHSPTGSCLRIVAVSRRERFVRILNQSLEETAELDGLVLQQRVGAARVCTYRFPPCTQLAPRHHVTVWGEGPAGAKKQLPPSLRGEPVHFHSGPGCVTLLLSPKGEVLSQHRAPHCVTPASRIFTDDTDLSIDRFPISEAQAGADAGEQSLAQEAPARRRRKPGCMRAAGPSGSASVPMQAPPRGLGVPARTRVLLPRLGASEPSHPCEAAAQPERSERTDAHAPQLLSLVPETALRLEDLGARKEPTVRVSERPTAPAGPPPPPSPVPPRPRPAPPSSPAPAPPLSPRAPQVGRRSVDRGFPMVALSVQNTAESRFGFRFLSCPPITADACGPVRARCGAEGGLA